MLYFHFEHIQKSNAYIKKMFQLLGGFVPRLPDQELLPALHPAARTPIVCTLNTCYSPKLKVSE